MSIWLREDTAVTIVLGPFVDPTTPATEEEALTVNQASVRLSKNGGAFAQKNDATTASHMENGFYSCPLNATDTSTPGSLVVAVDDASALIWWKEYHVVPQQVWDSYFSTDRLQVHAAEMSADLITSTVIQNDAITAAKIQNGAIDAATFAAGAINAAAIATDAVTEIQSGLSTISMSTALPGTPTADTVGDALKRASVGIPQSAPGASGGLALYDDLFSVVAEGTIATVTNAGDMTVSAGFNGTVDGFYAGMFMVPQSGNAAHQPRAISVYTASTRRCQFTGTGTQLTRAFSAAPTAGDPIKILGLAGTL